MSASNVLETNLLKLILQNIACSDIGDAAGLQPSGAPGVVEVSLHTADPGEIGDQTTNECTYTGYARVPVVRSVALWDVTLDVGSNLAAVVFGACTVGVETATHWRIGADHAGAGHVHFTGAISSPVGGLAISPGITPSFAIGKLTVTCS